jgi:hypothetical protein
MPEDSSRSVYLLVYKNQHRDRLNLTRHGREAMQCVSLPVSLPVRVFAGLTQEDSCVDTNPPCLHLACTDLALRELVIAWRQLSAEARETIVKIARDR